MATKHGSKAAAIVTIHKAANMTPEGKREIAAWLKKQAGFLLKNADKMSLRYTARYLYK
jgi:hypothetical protein